VIRQAALYFATADDVHAAHLPVVGRPVAFRAILAAVRAGVLRVAVPTALRSPALDAALATSPSARAAVAWCDSPGALALEPVLLLPAAALAPASALDRLLQAPAGRVLAESQATDAPALTVDGVWLAGMHAALVAGRPIGDVLARELKGRDVAAVQGHRWFVRVSGAGAAAEAEARLWRELGSPIDTRFDVAVHRRLSRWVTRAAVAQGVTPNCITVTSGVVGLAAAAAVARADAAALAGGLLLYFVAVVLDHSDGEVARLTLTESAVGEWLDIVLDTIVHTSLVLALGHAASSVTGGGLAAGVAAAMGVLASAVVGKLWPPAPLTAAHRGLLDALTSRDGFYVMLVLFLVLRIAAPALLPTLMIVVAAGTHAYWIARLALLWRRRRRAGDDPPAPPRPPS
jgi:phosphatidylglycerophosphate synthase